MQLKLRQQASDTMLRAHDLKRKDKELEADVLFREAEMMMQQDNELDALQRSIFDLTGELITEEPNVGQPAQ